MYLSPEKRLELLQGTRSAAAQEVVNADAQVQSRKKEKDFVDLKALQIAAMARSGLITPSHVASIMDEDLRARTVTVVNALEAEQLEKIMDRARELDDVEPGDSPVSPSDGISIDPVTLDSDGISIDPVTL